MDKPVAIASIQEAIDLLHFCLEENGEVIPSRHFRDELANEKLTIEDAWMVLAQGRIFNPPEKDIKTGEWKWSVEGHESGGKWLVIVFSFKTIARAFLITVFSVEARR